MLTVSAVDFSTFENEAKAHQVSLPLEQTEIWAKYQATVPGREAWKNLVIKDGSNLLALVSFMDYETHGYHFLRASHAPVWVVDCTEQHEKEVLNAVKDFVKKEFPKAVFMRMAVEHKSSLTQPVLSTRPYDATVVIDLAGGEDDVFSRMKKRGRRDVRKALRECPAICADETEQASQSFDEYYPVMQDTGRRDHFVPAPQKDFEQMLRMLGPNHCRLYAARIDGVVVSWSIVTINDMRATRYYAAMATEVMRNHVSEVLVFHEILDLQKCGLVDYDLMGIGSDFAPSLLGLNEFKTKFIDRVVDVAPDRDVPVNTAFYKALQLMKKVKGLVSKVRK
ncbi:lipid II:glycine glycyltransferase FemX [Arcanobacterium ihumii]|uniref:lipid II:glycine glycyltransferase FemX n=1 Tax=Arcanobacterium ihumii TaxID=2138162 RepID=UPI000F52ECF4|nr:peptidoglycan bridge formation glycyltransferase FemA/FemB family protein [Arcanobacterium ihumii]